MSDLFMQGEQSYQYVIYIDVHKNPACTRAWKHTHMHTHTHVRTREEWAACQGLHGTHTSIHAPYTHAHVLTCAPFLPIPPSDD